VDDVEAGRLEVRDSHLLYGASPGALELLEVQPPGKRAMETEAWLRGNRVR
jgi:methionyl-tRNA formyltransferase